VPPLVPGFITTGGMSMSANGSEWVAVRNLDGHRVVLKVVPVADVTQAQALAAQQIAVYDRIENDHLVRRHGAIAMADGTLALVLDEVSGGSLAQLLGARGQLTAGETVTTVAPLFRALADLHAAGVVHGDLAPGNVLFSAGGRPLIGDLGVAGLLGRYSGTSDQPGTGGFVAPELVVGAAPSPFSDVYAMAALGWFCLTGSPPAPAAVRPSLIILRPETPLLLVKVLTAGLATDPAARPCADAAAAEVFDAAPAEAVALASVADPAAEITRRIRAAAASVTDPAPRGSGREPRPR
jgi:eukaryotic-like serine/threonine-protein kinase